MNPTVKLKDIERKIRHSERKIELMRNNGSVGSIIDNLAGNNIAIEKCKISELQATLKSAQMESEIYEKNRKRRKTETTSIVIEVAAIAASLLFF
jgi:hypothetical protein